jgi:F0F1-type ATP synthase gamma subunit
MTAMHSRAKRTGEAKQQNRDQLKLTHNKARQAAITNEILKLLVVQKC